MTTLYERLGGRDAVSAAVELFYAKVLADPRLRPFFEHVDRRRLIGSQRAFLTMAFGGPTLYAGRDLRTAHAHLVRRGLDDSHFDAVLAHLGATLTELDVPADEAAEVTAIAASVRADVLGRTVASVAR